MCLHRSHSLSRCGMQRYEQLGKSRLLYTCGECLSTFSLHGLIRLWKPKPEWLRIGGVTLEIVGLAGLVCGSRVA